MSALVGGAPTTLSSQPRKSTSVICEWLYEKKSVMRRWCNKERGGCEMKRRRRNNSQLVLRIYQQGGRKTTRAPTFNFGRRVELRRAKKMAHQ